MIQNFSIELKPFKVVLSGYHPFLVFLVLFFTLIIRFLPIVVMFMLYVIGEHLKIDSESLFKLLKICGYYL